MLEGDLLEVTLDENHSIWQLLQAGQPPDVARIRTLLEVMWWGNGQGQEIRPSRQKFQAWPLTHNSFLLVCVLFQLEKPEHQGSQIRGQVLEKRQRRQRKVDLGRKSKRIVQEELESKKARSSQIKPEEGQEEEEFEEGTVCENIFMTPSAEHNPILKGNQNNLQEKDSAPTTPFPSSTPLVHLSYPEQQECDSNTKDFYLIPLPPGPLQVLYLIFYLGFHFRQFSNLNS